MTEGTEPQITGEQRLREDYNLLETAKAQLEALIRQQQLIQLAVDEHVRARETVRALANGAPGDDVLIPLGADSYVHAKISEDRTAILGIGSGVSLRKTSDEAEKFLDAKIDDLSRAFKSVTERAQQMEGAVQELTAKVQSQYGAIQSSASKA